MNASERHPEPESNTRAQRHERGQPDFHQGASGQSAESAAKSDSGNSTFRIPQSALLYDSITPVNTFRVILNRLFDAGLPLLPDRSYFSSIARPYDFYDMTDSTAYIQAMNKWGKTGLTVIAFPHEAQIPEQPERYCRRLVVFKYGEAGQTVKGFYIKPVDEDLSIEQAGELYRRYVKSGTLPDFGSSYETWRGIGPDQLPVVALFFSSPGRP